MNRGLGLCVVLLVLLGCQTTQPVAVHEAIPPPFTVNGTAVALADERWGWEREPFNGPVTLYRLGRVTPNPWSQLAKETEAIVAAMPEKPERVDVIVTSFRLVRKADQPNVKPDPSENVRIGKQSLAGLNVSQNGLAYEQLKSAMQTGDQKTANAVGKGLIFQNGDPSIGVGTPPQPDDGMPGVLDDHPPGASCRVRATVRLIFPGGREQLVDVKAIAAGQNTSGTKYYGEALDFATKMAIRQYGNQFRKAVGLPTDY